MKHSISKDEATPATLPAHTDRAGAHAAHLLQRAVGNRAIQAKLEVGAADSPLEAEADRIADEVVGDASPSSAPVATAAPPPLDAGTAASIDSARGAGRPLDGALRDKMESTLGADLSSVRMHTDDTADTLSRSIGARAFTAGNDVFFKAGEYDTSSTEGQHLIAHEVAHTQQQSAPAVARKADDDDWYNPWTADDTAEHQTQVLGPVDNAPPLQNPNLLTVPDATIDPAFEPTSTAPTGEAAAYGGRFGAATDPAFGKEPKLGRLKQAKAFAQERGGDLLDVADLGVAGGSAAVGAAGAAIKTVGLGASGAAALYGGVSTMLSGRQAYTGRRAKNKLAALNPASEAGREVHEYAVHKKANEVKRASGMTALGFLATTASATALATAAPVAVGLGIGLAVLNLGVSAWRATRSYNRRNKKKREAARSIADLARSGDPNAVQFVEGLGVKLDDADARDLASKIEGKLGPEFASKRYQVAQQLLTMMHSGGPDDRADATEIVSAVGGDPKALVKQMAKGDGRAAMHTLAGKLTGG